VPAATTTSSRTVVFGLIAVLLLTPVLGFAAGDPALSIRDAHPRHAAGHHDHALRPAGENPPGAVVVPVPGLLLAVAGWLAPTDPAAMIPVVTSPPFVPPRAEFLARYVCDGRGARWEQTGRR
jgi:hypothetical protein